MAVLTKLALNTHLAHLEIHTVIVSSHVADFIHYDPLSHITLSKADDVHLYPELKRKLYSALAECDEGELSIQLPPQVITRLVSLDQNACTTLN